MDTNLKRTHKLATFIISIIILGAAYLVTALYPQMDLAMYKLRSRYEELYDEERQNFTEWTIKRDMVNYAVESSYYMYGLLLQETEGFAVAYSNIFYTFSDGNSLWPKVPMAERVW